MTMTSNHFEFNFENVALAAVFIVGIWFISKIFLIEDVLIIPRKKRHSWKSVKILDRACYCSICEILLTSSAGLFCESCGVCSHSGCIKKADGQLKCKEKYVSNGKSIQHLWVKGNLPLTAECSECHEEVDYHSNPGLAGYRCCWCQRTLHNHCFKNFVTEAKCDFGEFRDMIFPPTSIIAARTRESFKFHLTGINPPDWEDWKPLIVIANIKAGSNSAAEVVCLLRGILHPLQVMELGRHGPNDALQWAVKASPKQCRILVAGGDGTIGWVLNTIFSLNIKPIPEVAVLPMGTGNDLSRVMGWGAEPPDEINPLTILQNIKSSSLLNLDRWILEIETLRYRLPIKRAPLRTIYVYNYFSIGVDAQVTLNFHKTRESKFYVLSSRVFNKILYFCFGTHQIVQPDCDGLEKRLDLYLDDVHIDLPELQSVVFLNIDSWGAGCKLCELSKDDEYDIKHSISDGILEVFGIVSSFHIAQLQVGISKPVRLGQAKCARIKLRQPCPMQADGEPWLQSPCDIRLSARGQAKMLKYTE